MEKKTNGIGIAAMVCGILSCTIALVPIPGVSATVGFILAILGIVFGLKGKQFAAEHEGSGHGMANAGYICGIIGVILACSGIICFILCVGAGAGTSCLAGL